MHEESSVMMVNEEWMEPRENPELRDRLETTPATVRDITLFDIVCHCLLTFRHENNFQN